jgi:DNA-binding winged helix-turn-helix (wHTH) protein
MALRFGDFRLDLEARQLWRETDVVRLRTRTFDLLELLVRRRPRVLGKAEIHRHLWPGTVVGDVALTVLVAELREALGDDARHPRYVRTVHRHGYAFCAEVVEEAEPPTPARKPARVLWEGRSFGLREGENVLGRDDGCDVSIDLPGVSRRHARLVLEGGRATLEDLGSKNGTFVGDGEVRVAGPTPLRDGSPFRLGRVLLMFRSGRAALTTVTDGGSRGAGSRESRDDTG